MATKNIVPRTGSQGQLGTDTKPWKRVVADSGSFDYISGSIYVVGDVTASKFKGDGSGLTNVNAGGIEFTDINNKNVAISGSWQGALTDGSLSNFSGSGVSTASFGRIEVTSITASGVIRADAFQSKTGGDAIEFSDAISSTGDVTATGGVLGNIRVGVTGDNEIDTSTGNLTLDSNGGTTTIDDDLSVSGNSFFDGHVTASGNISSSNSITASAFKGDGSGLTNVAASSISYSNIVGTPSSSFSLRITQATSSISSITSSIAKLTTNSGSFSSRITSAEATSSALTTDSGSFSTRLTLATSSISSITSSIANLKTRMSTEEANVDNLEAKVGQSLNTSDSPVFSGLRVSGDIHAERYIVSSSISVITSSFSSGSTIFGDTNDDTHKFTGSLSISGSITQDSTFTASFGELIVDGTNNSQNYSDFSASIQSRVSDAVSGGVTSVAGGTGVSSTGGNTPTLAIDFEDSDFRSGISGSFGNQRVGTTDNVTFNHITASGNISGSVTSTGSFGTINIAGDWTNAGNTVADGGTFTTIDIDGGTINGITDLAIADGGTGASTAENARRNLHYTSGIVSGSAQINSLINDTIATTIVAEIDNDEIPIAKLAEDSITIAGNSTALGGSITSATILEGTSVVSGSTLSSPSQGTIRLATNGVNTDVDSGLQTADNPTFAGGTLGNVQVGITADGTIDTTSGNLTINSTDGTVTVDDNLTISGNLTANGNIVGDESTTIAGISTITATGNISSSHSSTGSFGRVEATHISASKLFVNAESIVIGGVTIGETVASNIQALDQSVNTTSNVLFNEVTSSTNVSASGEISAGTLKVNGKSVTVESNTTLNQDLTTDASPQFTALEIGHASDTTLARSSEGNLSIEGNLIYRAGGTDVPVTDGGTGASTAAAAATNLGLGTSDNVTFNKVTASAARINGNITASAYFGDGSNLTGIVTTPFPFTGSAGIQGTLSLTSHITSSGNISGSHSSTGSFGHVHIRDGLAGLGIGDENDLLLYHDGSNSYIKDNGTGGLRYRGGTQTFQNGDGSKTMMVLNAANTVDLHYNNDKKFETTRTGVNVTGAVTASSIDIDSIQGNWTNAGNTVADLGTITTVDINGGTINGITDLAIADGGTGASTAANARLNLLHTSGIVSGSTIASSAQGQFVLTTNGVAATAVDLGLQSTDNPTFAGGTLGNIQVGVTGDNEIDTTSGNLTIDSDGGTTTLDDNVVISGNLTVNGTTTQVDSTTVSIGDKIIELNAGSAAGDGGIYVKDADGNQTGSLLWDVSENRWIGGLKDAEVNLVTISSTDTLTNKGINLANNTVTGTTAEFNTALSDDSFATLTNSVTLTNKTLTSPDINTPDIDGGTIDNTIIGASTAAKGVFTEITASGHISSSATSTGSFGRLEASFLSGNSPLVIDADQTSFSSPVTMSSGFRIDSLTANRVPFATTNGRIVDDSDFTFSTDTLTVTKLGAFQAVGAIDFNSQAMTNVDINSGTINGITDLAVADGGTGASELTDGGVLLGSGTDAITATAVLGNGELLIGDNSGDPTVATLTGTANRVTVTNGAGSITLSAPQDIHTSANPTFAGGTLGNIQVAVTGDNEIDTTSGNLTLDSAGGTVTVDDNLTVNGNTILGDASGDTVTINAETIDLANIAAGTDNSVVVYNGSSLVTDEIDSRVWGSTLLDTDGTGTDNELAIFTDSNTVEGSANLTYDGTRLVVVGHVSASEVSSSTYYGDGSNLTGISATPFPFTGSAGISGSLSIDRQASNSGSTIFDIKGTQGTLFSVVDEMSGSIFTATTIAGLPVIEAFSDSRVKLGPISNRTSIDTSGNIDIGGNISGSGTSTGSFGSLVSSGESTFGGQLRIPAGSVTEPAIVFSDDDDGGGTGIYRGGANNIRMTINGTKAFELDGSRNLDIDGDITTTDGTFSGDIVSTKTNGVISGSSTSTGSFGRVNASTIDIDSIQGNWTNAGNTVADLGTITTVDINGGTIDGITSLTAGGDLDIGSHDLRAATLTADGLTSGRVVFAGTNGVLSDDSDFSFSTDTLTVTKLGAFQAVGAIDFNSQAMTNVDINSGTINGITDLAIADGGTGASTAAAARVNLNAGSGIVSGSSVASSAQGQFVLTTNDVAASAVDLGLQTGDSPTFASLTLSGNLTVNGTTTTVNSTEVSIGDKIITLNAGSAAGDGGIYVNDADTTETGSLLWDVSTDRWIGGLKDAEVNLVTISSTDTLTNKTLTSPDINAGTVDSITSLTTGNIAGAVDLKDGGGNTVITYPATDMSGDAECEVKIGDVDSATTGTFLSIKPYGEEISFGGADLLVSGEIKHIGDTDTKINFTDDQIRFTVGNAHMLTLDEGSSDNANFVVDKIDIGSALISGSTSSTGSFGKVLVGSSNLVRSGSSLFEVVGNQGTLFNVTDEMSGSIFSANTVAGLPVIEAFSDQRVKIGRTADPITVKASSNNETFLSGSAQSTASFGRIQASTIGGNSPLTVEASNFTIDADGTFSGSAQATASFGVLQGKLEGSKVVISVPSIRSSRFRGRSPVHIDAGTSEDGVASDPGDDFIVSSGSFFKMTGPTGGSSETYLNVIGSISASTGMYAANHINLGHDTDTTITRASSGDIAIEGNTVYRAGGTNIPVSDGGTGASSFADKSVIITQDSGTDTLAAVAMSTNGQLLIGGSDGPAVSTLTAGSNVTITNGNGAITIASTDTNTMGSGFTVSADTNTATTTITQGDTLTIAGGTNVSTVSNPDGTITITSTDTNTMGTGFTVSATTDTTATTITQGDDLFFAAGAGITCETTADGTVTITNTSLASSVTRGTLGVDTDDDVRFDSLGIGMNATGTTGQIDAAADVIAYSSSDRRWKENLIRIPNPLDKIGKISGYEFDWKELTDEERKTQHSRVGHDVGVVAQEIQEVLPEVVKERDNGYLAVDYEKIVPLLIESIKELKSELDELKKKV